MNKLNKNIQIILSRENYLSEIGHFGLPFELNLLLQQLVDNHIFRSTLNVPATPAQIRLAQKHLPRTITIEDEESEFLISVFVPETGTHESPYWVLQKVFPNGKIVALADL
jgi:hypothetical protein